MSVELIYRTSDSRAVEWMRDVIAQRHVVREKRVAYMAEMLAEFGPVGKRCPYSSEDEPGRALVGRNGIMMGLACRHDEVPPADSGWRLDSKTGYWLPKKATTKGKERVAELAALNSPQEQTEEIGFDSMWWGDSKLFRPGFLLREDIGEVWVYWSGFECRKAMKDAGDDGIAWEEVPRSEWYAWREAVDAGTQQEGKN